MSTSVHANTPGPAVRFAHILCRIALLALAGILVGCTTYHPQPLPSSPQLLSDLKDFQVDRARLAMPGLRRHHFDARDGLDMTEVAMLAVVNNPGLREARAQMNVAHAQAFAAGLLPDPQLSASEDRPTPAGPGLTTASSAGIGYELNAIMTHGAERRAGLAEAKKADLDLLWREWQVIARARTLFVATVTDRKALSFLRDEQKLFRDRYERMDQAMAQGNVTINDVSAYLSALQGVNEKISSAERKLNDRTHELDALLGVDPDARLVLDGGASSPSVPDAKAILKDLPQRIGRRPDLRALRAGYAAQQQRVRAAILGQFPAINIAFNKATDTSNVHTQGLSLSLVLPLFNGNRGAIAVARATRKEFYAQYQARLDSAYSDVHRLLANEALLLRQRARSGKQLAQLQQAGVAARNAYRQGTIDALQYTNLESARIDANLQSLNLDKLLWQQWIGLESVIGSDIPEVSPSKGIVQ